MRRLAAAIFGRSRCAESALRSRGLGLSRLAHPLPLRGSSAQNLFARAACRLYYFVMFTPTKPFSFRWVASAAAGFGVAFGGLYWLTTLPRSESLVARTGHVCATFCVLSVAVFCWAVILAYVGRERKWSPKTCRLAGLSFFLPFIPLFVAMKTQPATLFANVWAIGAIFTGLVCQKFVYPHVASDDLSAPEPPLTLFPK